MFKHTFALAYLAAALLIATCLAAPAAAADAQRESASTSVFPDRLSFPEPDPVAAPKVPAPPAAPQAAVALPTPHFKGLTAIAVLALLLCCRKPILKLVC